MGYIKTKNSEVVVDAILTPAGRAELSQGHKLDITRFVLSDDQVNYGLYNVQNPGGSDYYDIAIRSLPVLEPSIGVDNPFKYNLYTDNVGAINIASLYLTGNNVSDNGTNIYMASLTPVQISVLMRNITNTNHFFYAVLENNFIVGTTKRLILANNDQGTPAPDRAVWEGYMDTGEVISSIDGPVSGGAGAASGTGSTGGTGTDTTGGTGGTNLISDYDNFIASVVNPFNQNIMNRNKTMIAFKYGFSLTRTNTLTLPYNTSITIYPSATISHIAPVTAYITSNTTSSN